MKRLITLSLALPAVLVVAACGGGGSGGGGSSGASSSAAQGAGSTTVSVRQLPSVGSVLVDDTGKALYSSDLEATGKIVCDTAACTAFWKPLTLGGGQPTASAGAGRVGVITRPDGSKQVTVNGKPLYTFSEDSPGKATGNGFSDDFAGHHFTWNVVRGGGTTGSGAASGSGGSTSGNGGASSSGNGSASGGGYGY